MPLLRDGFSARPRQSHWTTIRDQMIILLLHFGGKRLSEVLHLWIGDVERHPIDPTRCIPWIAHPTEAVVDWRDPKTNVEKRVTRQECLLLRYGIKPLTLRTGARRVGWKNPMTTDTKRMRVFWNDASADRLFWSLYNQYVQLRPRVARHPFLFMTPAGEPMTVQAFEKVHAAAVRRIGLVPAKQLGTTPHGHRHAYGHQAEARQVGTKVMQIALGHKSPYSQEVYKNSDDEVVAKAMTSGEERLSCIMNIRVIVGHK